MSKIYIHYGSDKFELEKFKPIRNMSLFTKPYGGFWGTPIDTPENWYNWCIGNNFHLERLEKSFQFKLKKNTRLLYIDDVEQLKSLPKAPNGFELAAWECLDFEKLKEKYDAIEITLSEEKTQDPDIYWGGLYNRLYGWDCDSIVIMNPDCIEVVKNEAHI